MKKTIVIAACSVLLSFIFSTIPSTSCWIKEKNDGLKTGSIKCHQIFQPTSAAACESPSDGPDEDYPSGSVSILTVILAFLLFSYLFGAVCLFLIIRKLNVPYSWIALVPIAQAWSYVAAAGKPWWLVVLTFVPYINIIVFLYLWGCILAKIGKHPALSLLFLLPVVNLVFLGVLALSSMKTIEKSHQK